jgi:hypothetical protein
MESGGAIKPAPMLSVSPGSPTLLCRLPYIVGTPNHLDRPARPCWFQIVRYWHPHTTLPEASQPSPRPCRREQQVPRRPRPVAASASRLVRPGVSRACTRFVLGVPVRSMLESHPHPPKVPARVDGAPALVIVPCRKCLARLTIFSECLASPESTCMWAVGHV